MIAQLVSSRQAAGAQPETREGAYGPHLFRKRSDRISQIHPIRKPKLTHRSLAYYDIDMKITIDLPKDLIINVKIRAAQDKRTLEEVTAEALRSWLVDGGRCSSSEAASEPSLTPEKMKRLQAFHAYRSHFETNPPSRERQASLVTYLAEYREDRQTFGGREQAR